MHWVTGIAMRELARDTHRTHDRVERGADLARPLHLLRRLAHGLYHERDRALGAIEVGDREGNALPFRVRHHDDELAGLRCLREQRVPDLDQVRDRREVLARDDFE